MFWPEASCSNTKTKVKIPSVITSDRWLIFAQKKHDDKLKKEKDKEAAKERKNMKKNNSNIKKEKNKEQQNAKSEKKTLTKKKTVATGTQDVTKEDWYCRLCQTSTKLDMIQCMTCKVWFHVECAKVQLSEATFYCVNCKV